MHLIKDENGNLIAHGHGTHEHGHTHENGTEHSHSHEHGTDHAHEHAHDHAHDHAAGQQDDACSHHCGSCDAGDCRNETVALLTYMLQHNEHHASELDQMADNLDKLEMHAAARTIRESVADFQKANMRLGLALTLVKEELKSKE